jgi:hypothetical protein
MALSIKQMEDGRTKKAFAKVSDVNNGIDGMH